MHLRSTPRSFCACSMNFFLKKCNRNYLFQLISEESEHFYTFKTFVLKPQDKYICEIQIWNRFLKKNFKKGWNSLVTSSFPLYQNEFDWIPLCVYVCKCMFLHGWLSPNTYIPLYNCKQNICILLRKENTWNE